MSRIWHSMKTIHKNTGTKPETRRFEPANHLRRGKQRFPRHAASSWVEIAPEEKVSDVRFLSEAAPHPIAKC